MAAALSCHRTRVSHWCRDGIPPRRFAEIVSLAKRRGCPEVTLEALFKARRQAEQRRRRRVLVVA